MNNMLKSLGRVSVEHELTIVYCTLHVYIVYCIYIIVVGGRRPKKSSFGYVLAPTGL